MLTSNLQSSVGAGGPQPAYFMYTNGAFGSVENFAEWSVKITGTGGAGGNANQINPSTVGMGVANNQFQTTETMRLEFDDEPASGAANLAYLVRVGVNGLDAGETIAWTASLVGGGTISGTATSANLINGSIEIQATVDKFLDYVDLVPGANTEVRITSVSTFVLDETVTKTLNFGFAATDSDGDPVSGSFTITAQNSHTLSGDENNNALGGGSGDDILTAAGGDDILTGSGGQDAMTGGTGSDTFKFTGSLIAENSDTISDFSFAPVASGGDVLDLHDVLPVDAWGATDLGTLEAYISVTPGTNTVISVDAGDGPVQVVTLTGVTATLAELLDNNQIHT